MATYKQRAANRANAQKSTGPKTEEGKARSKMNRLTHGLTAAQRIVIENEDSEEFEALRADLIAKFQPSSGFAQELVDYLAAALWRLRRIPGLEADLLRACQKEAHAEAIKERDTEYHQSLIDETNRRCADALENDQDAILEAKMNGTWGRLYSDFREAVEAEAIEQGRDVTTQDLSTTELDQARAVGLLKIITDPERSEAIRKLGRYEAGLMNTIFRLLRLLEVDLLADKVIKM